MSTGELISISDIDVIIQAWVKLKRQIIDMLKRDFDKLLQTAQKMDEARFFQVVSSELDKFLSEKTINGTPHNLILGLSWDSFTKGKAIVNKEEANLVFELKGENSVLRGLKCDGDLLARPIFWSVTSGKVFTADKIRTGMSERIANFFEDPFFKQQAYVFDEPIYPTTRETLLQQLIKDIQFFFNSHNSTANMFAHNRERLWDDAQSIPTLLSTEIGEFCEITDLWQKVKKGEAGSKEIDELAAQIKAENDIDKIFVNQIEGRKKKDTAKDYRSLVKWGSLLGLCGLGRYVVKRRHKKNPTPQRLISKENATTESLNQSPEVVP